MPTTTLIDHAIVVAVDPQRTVIHDGAVAIQGAWITEVGGASELEARHPDATRVDGSGKMLLPGFVNLHVHCAIGVTRGIADDLGGAPIYRSDIPQGVRLSAEDTYLLSRLGALQALLYGSTTIVENYIHSRSNVKALSEIGVRAYVSERVHDADLYALRDRTYRYDVDEGRRLLAENRKLIDEWHGHDGGRILCQVGPHGPDTVSPGLMREARALARDAGVGMTIHLGQSQREADQIHRAAGVSPVRHLQNLDVLGPHLIAGHCAFLDQGDAELLASTGTNVGHLPTVNAKNGWIAPIPLLRELGANVGLGTDNMVHDIIEAMRFAVCVSRIQRGSAEAIRAMDVLEMATINGARAIGRDADLGSIEPGKLADLILVDMRGANVAPVLDPVASLVYAGQSADIDSVFIGGRMVVEDHRARTVDGTEVVRTAQERSEHLWRTIAGWRPVDGPRDRMPRLLDDVAS